MRGNAPVAVVVTGLDDGRLAEIADGDLVPAKIIVGENRPQGASRPGAP